MEKVYYSADSLERALLSYERHYGLGSAEFYELYLADDLTADRVHRHHQNTWASFYRDVLRLRRVDLAGHVDRSLELV